MIRTLDENKSYNPIRSHIKVTFTGVKDYDEKIELIANDLIKNQFDSSKSRVLIFVSVKQRAEDAVEELSKALKDKDIPYCDKVDFYHAGLEGSEREEKFESYKTGEIVILITTKAFGMGMDIPNVHYVYHLDPSSNFEDFLQEVGRAGRNEKANLDAGFTENNPIKTNCIIAPDDFKNLKDRLHDKQITWNHIIQVQKTIYDYVNKFSKKKVAKDEVFALPTDLLDQYAEYKGKEFDETFFRVILYWLEKLKKIKLGTYTPTHIPLTVLLEKQNYSILNNLEDVTKIKHLYSKLNIDGNSRLDEKGYYMSEMEDLKDFLEVVNIREVWRLLFLAQKAGAVKVEREISIEPTLTRKNELEKWDGYKTSPTIESVFAFTTKIMYASKFNQQTHFEGDQLDSLANKAMQEYLNPSKIYWKEYFKKSNKERNPESIAIILRDDFVKKRAKVSFKLIDFLPEGKQKSILQMEKGYKKPKITQLIFNGYKNTKDWELFFQDFKKNLYALIKYVHNKYINSNVQKHNIVDLLIELNIEHKGEEYFNQLIFVAKGLGFLKGNAGGLAPMGIELFILEENIIDNDNLSEFEKSTKQEFEESVRMKVLRLLALECLASSVKIDKYDEYIKAYFRCATETDFVKLLEEHLGENHEALEAFRAEALKNAIKSLNEDQYKVYNAPISDNLQVIAGPGSGKTHTLTLRVARLIQDENINPENILVLAYNRAVVVELKDRLNKLFRKLGYAKLIKRLKVFTFHGFCKYVLDKDLDESNFDNWNTQFLKVARESPGKISQKLGSIKYVFVDEFQDITGERLELLKFIAKPTETKLCVIGDPNQSIYGFARVKEGEKMSPQPYYKAFADLYDPKVLYLSVNYRSYSQILEKADQLLSLNKTKFEMPFMEAFHKYDGNKPICEFYDLEKDKTDWKVKLKEILEYKSEKGEFYKDVAIMFYSNIEVYRAFNEIRKLNLPDVRIRVQGAAGSLNKTREFHYFLNVVKNKSEEKLASDYFILLKNLKEPLLYELPNWNEYLIDVFLCIAHEYSKEMNEDSNYSDLFDFIEDISGKDDGQFGKLYQQNIQKISDDKPKKEIVLTTMHKVKGIEYDAVLIPSSLSNFALKSTAETIPNIDDVYEEERRLYYVAYTRAKYRLVVIKWKKENALYKTNPEPVEIFKPEDVEEKLGILMKEGIDKFTLYWGASDYGRSSFNAIKIQVLLGDYVKLKRRLQGNRNGPDFYVWEVLVNGGAIAQLSSNATKRLDDTEELSGFIVSAVYVHTYEETERSDNDWIARGKPNIEKGRPFAAKWTDEAKERGYIYLIDFSGYGKK